MSTVVLTSSLLVGQCLLALAIACAALRMLAGWRMDFSSRNAPTVRVHNICAPTASIRPHVRGLQFRASVGSPSAPQSYYVQAVNAGAVTIAAPANFEVSLSATGGFGPSLVLPAPAGPVTPPAA